MVDSELKKVCIKNRMCYYFDDLIKNENFDFDNTVFYWMENHTKIF